MPLTVASRFAVLKIDGDDDHRSSKKSTGEEKKKKNPPTNAKVTTTKGASAKTKVTTTTQPKKKKGASATDDQWNQWQKKDAEVVEGYFEEELHQAILLSKVDFEKNKDVYAERMKAAEAEKKLSGKKSKKSNKPQTMSLDQFNNLRKENHGAEVASTNGNGIEDEEEFFERIKDDTKEALKHEETRASKKVKEPKAVNKVKEPADINKAITQAQYQDTLEKKVKEISSLQEEVTGLKEELHNVKTRNKKLCQILANGEMKDKAQLLVELDKLHHVKDELSSEVASLHILLEQERSKNHLLTTDPKNKSQNKKRATSESTQH